jgi:hypothetical protein
MGNAGSETRPGRSAGTGVSSGLDRVREVARRDKDARFTALLHHVTPGLLLRSFDGLKKDAAPGTDGVTWRDYERGAFTSRRRTGGCGRSASRRWRTRFSSAPSRRC